MRNIHTKIASFLVVAVIAVLTVLCSPIVSARETIDSGYCGTQLTWILFDDGELVIEGSGPMWDWPNPTFQSGSSFYEHAPWILNLRHKITKITIEPGVTSIGSNAFVFCQDLTEISIPDTVTSIGDFSFRACIKLQNIFIHKNISQIGKCAFISCSSFDNIETDPNNPFYCSDNGILYTKDKTTLVQYPAAKTESSFTVPNGVTCVGSGSFSNSESLKYIYLPDCVTSIETCAFANSGLVAFTIPNKVTTIEKETFAGSKDLSDIKLSDNLTVIGPNAFMGCENLQNITIPDSVTTIETLAFEDCKNLATVTMSKNITYIGEAAFYHCYKLKSITLYDGLKEIYNKTFYSCSSLEEVILPASLTKIGDYAFYYCYSLKSINLPDGITNIGMQAFCGTSITNVFIPKNVSSLGPEAFFSCTALESIVVDPQNNYYLTDNEGVLFNADKTILLQLPIASTIKEYTIPATVETIENGALPSGYQLEKVITKSRYINFLPYAIKQNNSTYKTLEIIGYAGSNTEKLAENKGLTFIPYENPEEILGDITADGFVDLSDAILLFQHCMLHDLYPISYIGSIDFTKDWSIDIADAILVFRYSMMPDLYPIS